MRLFHYLIIFIISLISSKLSFSEPWQATGPLLAVGANVQSYGAYNISMYLKNGVNYGIYDPSQQFVPSPRYYGNSFDAAFNYGLAKDMDFSVVLSYVQNENEGQMYERLGDTLFVLDFQYMTQGDSKYKSSLLLEANLLVPTGKYKDLLPKYYTADSTGAGSYQPAVGIRFQHNFIFSEEHYLNLYVNTHLRYALPVKLDGLSSYGGSLSTDGVVNPGHSIDFSLSLEYSLNKYWSTVIESFVYAQQPSKFLGIVSDDLSNFIATRESYINRKLRKIIFNAVMPSIHNIGNNLFTGSGSVTMLTLATSIEYSISDSIGFIAGVWFSTPGGKNTIAFYNPMIGFVGNWNT